MQVKISSLYKGGEVCEIVIEVPNEAAAILHYESIAVRHYLHPEAADFTDWKMERLPVTGAVIVEGETETEEKARKIREKLARGESFV